MLYINQRTVDFVEYCITVLPVFGLKALNYLSKNANRIIMCANFHLIKIKGRHFTWQQFAGASLTGIMAGQFLEILPDIGYKL